MRTERPGRIVLGLVAPRLQNLRLTLIQFRIDQSFHLGERLQRGRGLRYNPLPRLIENLLYPLVHLLAIHGYTPKKVSNLYSPQCLASISDLPPICHRIPTAPPASAPDKIVDGSTVK